MQIDTKQVAIHYHSIWPWVDLVQLYIEATALQYIY